MERFFYIFIQAYGDMSSNALKYNSFLFVWMQEIANQIKWLRISPFCLHCPYALFLARGKCPNVTFKLMFSFENLNRIKQTVYFWIKKKKRITRPQSGSDQITVWALKQMLTFVNQLLQIWLENHTVFGRSVNMPALFHNIMKHYSLC